MVYYLWCPKCKCPRVVREKAEGDIVHIFCTSCQRLIRNRESVRKLKEIVLKDKSANGKAS